MRAKGNMQQMIRGLCMICQFVFKIIFIIAPPLIFRDNIPPPAGVYKYGKSFVIINQKCLLSGGDISAKIQYGTCNSNDCVINYHCFCLTSFMSPFDGSGGG